MTPTKAILCCLFTSFAVHYGWKMRGTVVGGEKGAMVPGLFAGLIPALFAGGAIAQYFWIPAAAGLIGMTYGGIEPYGDNIAWINDPDYVEPNPRKGYIGLAVKGALWFGIAGGYIGMSVSSMGGRYSARDIVVFFFSVLLAQFAGYMIFNQPYNKEKGIHPRIYLTFESRDEWGSNVGVLLTVLVFAIIRKDSLTAVMAVSGMMFGAVGWIAAMRLYHYTENPMKNGKYLLGIFSRKKLVGGWGNMEYCLGSFGGIGIALGFVISSKSIVKINNTIDYYGLFSPGENHRILVVMCFAALSLMLLAVNLYEFLCDRNGRKYSGFMMDCIERPLFSTIPFVFVLLGSLTAAKLMTAYMLVYALSLKNCFDRLEKRQYRNLYMICSAAICIFLFAATLVSGGFSPLIIALCATVPYIFSQFWWAGTNRKRGGWKTVFSLNSLSFGLLLLTVQSAIICIIIGRFFR